MKTVYWIWGSKMGELGHWYFNAVMIIWRKLLSLRPGCRFL